MVAQERINVRETVRRKNNCKSNFFSMYFVRTNKEIHFSFKNREKQRTQALTSIRVDKSVNLTIAFNSLEPTSFGFH